MNCEGLAIGGDGVLVLLFMEQGVTEAILCDGIVWCELDGFLKIRDGFFIVADLGQCLAEVIQSFAVVGLDFQSLAKQLDGGGIFFFLKMEHTLLIQLCCLCRIRLCKCRWKSAAAKQHYGKKYVATRTNRSRLHIRYLPKSNRLDDLYLRPFTEHPAMYAVFLSQ